MATQIEHYGFTGPEFHTKLSPLNHIAVCNWWPQILIFPLSGSADRVFRFPAGVYMNGIAVVILPLKNGDWEVMLTLEEKCMGTFKSDSV